MTEWDRGQQQVTKEKEKNFGVCDDDHQNNLTKMAGELGMMMQDNGRTGQKQQ